MNTVLQLRENRAKKWDAAKAFLDVKRGADGLLSAEDAQSYEKMEAEVVALGKEVERLERQVALDAELNKPTTDPLTSKPAQANAEQKTGRATDAYKKAFWNSIRAKNPRPEILNSLLEGTDSEGGYLVPDEFEKTLIQKLTVANVLRPLCHVIQTSYGDRKIPVVASKGTADWVDEEGSYPLSDDSFAQIILFLKMRGCLLSAHTCHTAPPYVPIVLRADTECKEKISERYKCSDYTISKTEIILALQKGGETHGQSDSS